MNTNDLLKQAVEQGASDLHVTVGAPPMIRLDGSLTKLSETSLKPEDTRRLVEQILQEKRYALLKSRGEVDFSYSVPGMGRFRVNVFLQRGTIGMAIRIINTETPLISELGLPDIVARLAMRPKGLILVAGPAGSGKTTTLAAMIDLINTERQCHIITLENPIEYLHKHKKSLITQREIGSDSESFSSALRAALRQDPDVIMVGEMRDLETISIALTAAETGHLVLASMHTLNAPQTINRIIEIFPSAQQEQLRVQLANNLVGIIAQRLLPRKDDQGRVAAVEFLAITPVVRNLIREGKIHQLHMAMQTGAKSGMRTMDSHLQQLFLQGLLKTEDILENASDRTSMSRFISQTMSKDGTEKPFLL